MTRDMLQIKSLKVRISFFSLVEFICSFALHPFDLDIAPSVGINVHESYNFQFHK